MHENKLLDIDDIALLSFGKNDGKFCCKRCMHMVKYLDEVAAHHKYHQLTDAGFVNQENLNPQFTSLPQKPKKNFKSMHHQKLQREPPRFCHSLQINRHNTVQDSNFACMWTIATFQIFSLIMRYYQHTEPKTFPARKCTKVHQQNQRNVIFITPWKLYIFRCWCKRYYWWLHFDLF